MTDPKLVQRARDWREANIATGTWGEHPWHEENVAAFAAEYAREVEREAQPLHVALITLYEANKNDECSSTYCSQGRGGLVYEAWHKVHSLLSPPQGEEAQADG